MTRPNDPADLAFQPPTKPQPRTASIPSDSDTPEQRVSSSPPVQVCGRYTLLDEIAHGGMGVVYRAHDSVLHRVVALKMLRTGLFATAEEVERFYREARAVAQLNDDHIIKIFEIGQDQGHHYFTMPLAAGGSLAHYRKEGGADPAVVVALVEKVARAVQHAHEQGILHRDLKPANVLLDDKGEPLVADFGLAKFLAGEMDLTQVGQMPGTLGYMAPEQLAEPPNPVTVRTEVWALGVMLYELLTGDRPFAGGSREAVVRAIRTRDPLPPSSSRPALDRTLAGIVMKCLAKKPERRYSSAAAVAADLRRWLDGWRRPEKGRAARVLETLRRRPWTAMIATMLVVAVLASLFLLRRQPEAEVREELPLILIGTTGGPQQEIWRIGQENATTMLEDSDGVFAVDSKGCALLELGPSPPWPGYRLEAQVRHDASASTGRVGIFFGYSQQSDGVTVHHCFWRLAYADRGLGRGLELKLAHFRSAGPRRGAVEHDLLSETYPDWPEKLPSPWRQLAVEVTPVSVRTFWEGNCIGEVPLAMWMEQAPSLWKDLPGAQPDFPPRGGMGLFVQGGRAAFRQVVVKRLPGGD
jgi:serine/threonine-protein kinase